MKLLILGGTQEAHELSGKLHEKGVTLLHARAGILESDKPPYPYRDGGFGGAPGLARFAREGGFTHLLLASHPFARQIAANAMRAAKETGLPLVKIARPEWEMPEGANWQLFDEFVEMLPALPKRARVFLAIGRQNLHWFRARADLWYLTRVIKPPANPLPGEQIIARPPFTFEGERALMQQHEIDCLVTKASGGPQTRAKIDAASALGLPILMLRRPIIDLAALPADPEMVLNWMKENQ